LRNPQATNTNSSTSNHILSANLTIPYTFMLALELHSKDIPAIYERFAHEIGAQSWKDRVSSVKQEIKGNPLLQSHHLQESAIAFQLEKLRALQERYGRVAVMAYNDHSHYPAASFATQVLSVIDASSSTLAERFRARVRAGLRTNPADLRALRLELMTATHFLRAGKKVTWPEMSSQFVEGQCVCDLLVEDMGPLGLELECKSFSEDKGRKITRREALEFFWLVRSNHWKRLRAGTTGVAVVMTVQRKLPTAYKDRVALASLVASEALSGQARILEMDGVTVQTLFFDAPQFGAELRISGGEHNHQRRVLDELTGTKNRETVAMSTDAGGALVLAIQSREDDTVMDAIMRTLKDSASTQFTGQRAGMMVAGFDGLSAEQLLNVVKQDQYPEAVPTALRMHASRFLGSAGRDHIVGAVFLSSSALRPSVADTLDSGGIAYSFPKRESSFWSDDFSDLFGRQG
jgi:hypothetical protein